jgi:hypothetical protein
MASASVIMVSLPRNIRKEASSAAGSMARIQSDQSMTLAHFDLTPSDIDGVVQENVGAGEINLHFQLRGFCARLKVLRRQSLSKAAKQGWPQPIPSRSQPQVQTNVAGGGRVVRPASPFRS